MEIELKYLLKDDFAKDRILEDDHLCEIKDSGSDATIHMRAIYYDTKDGDLRKIHMALRSRYENDRIVVTLKWRGNAEDGLHIRGEFNVPADDDFPENPDINIFRESEIFDELEAAVGGERLIPIMEMDFIRKQIGVDTGSSISVVSLDEGKIYAAGKEADILELEIELYSGDCDDMIALGQELASKYNLAASDESKFRRGLELMELSDSKAE